MIQSSAALMDIDQYLEPEFDFSELSPEEIESMGDISLSEVISAFKNTLTIKYNAFEYPPEANRWIYVGFGDRCRCLYFEIHFNEDHKISFLNINLLNDYEIRLLWC